MPSRPFSWGPTLWLSGSHVVRLFGSAFSLTWNISRSKLGMLMSLGGRVHFGFPLRAQLNDLFLSILNGLYLCEELAIDLHHHFSFVFGNITMDGDQFSYAVCRTRCSLSCCCKSATRWMSCPQDGVDSSSSPEVLTSWWLVLLGAMVVENLSEDVKGYQMGKT